MKTGLRFSCTIGNLPPMTFAVVNFTLDEALSALFTLSLTLAANRSDIDTDTLLLQTGLFTVTRDDILQREVKGLVASAVVGATNRHQTQYHLTVRPEMWLLTLDQDSRIYHQLSVPDILQRILKQKKLRANMHLNNPHSTREYVTMKRESSYDFFTRLAAEEGIFFWFADDGLYLSDSYLNMRAPDTLIYNPDVTSAVEENVIYKWSLGSYMRPESTDQKDRNYHNPNYALQHNATDFEAENGTPFHIFESYGRFQKDKEGIPFTQYRLEALRADSKSGQADSNCIRLMPGRIFTLTNHPIDTMNDRWQVISSQHMGHVPAVLGDGGTGTTLNSQTQFIPGRNDWRPPYRYKPLADGDEIATVVGPGTEEIYVNKDGAVRVHFHWNRYDAPDDQASCWVRVAQGWNGNGFGFLATPRVGQEVIISYLNGDIDRPIITGCTYNGLNRPPLNLPAEKTRTTFRTKTHKGNGFNELRFEDANGSEEVFIHAQRDMNTQVLNDETHNIGHNRTDHIKHDAHLRIDNEYRVQTGNDISLSTGQKLHIKADDALLTQSGNEIHLSSGAKVVIDAGSELTLQAAGHFLKIDAGGITSSASINFGSGAPGSGSGWGGKLPDRLDKLKQTSVIQAEKALTVPLKEICLTCLLKAEQDGTAMVIRGAVMTPELQKKWSEYREMHPEMKWYALVSGLQYERHFAEEIKYIVGTNNPLFRQYPDAKIAFAGPWLFDMAYAKSWEEKLSALEKVAPSVSWLHTTLSLDKLTRHLENYLNVELETGETALLRFYDPRILHQIRDIFSPEQLSAFTDGIHEWVYSFDNNDHFVKGA